jgi:hypothetical protein
VFGLALSTIIASGMNIYFVRREAQGRATPRLEAAWAGITWGTPATLALTLLASVSGITEEAGLVALFWFQLTAIVAACLFIGDAPRCRRVLKLAGTILLVSGTLVHTIRNSDAFGQASLMPVSVCAVAIALLLAASARNSRSRRPQTQQAPAE